MRLKKVTIFVIGLSFLTLGACKLSENQPSEQMQKYAAEYGQQKSLAQVRFIFDEMGTFSLEGLMDARTMPTKVYGTAVLLAYKQSKKINKNLTRADLPAIQERYGFIRNSEIANWRGDLASKPQAEILGFIDTTIDREIFGKRYKVQVTNLSCAACHSGKLYNAEGIPQSKAWLGTPNSSLNFDGYLNQIYNGLKIGMSNKDQFLKEILLAYPETDEAEVTTIKKTIFPQVEKELKKLSAMNRVLPFDNGGPGTTNGLGSFKRNAKLIHNAYTFQQDEVGIISIPDLSLRTFRSSLTADGAYINPGLARYRAIDVNESQNPEHIDRIAELATFFTFPAMGNIIDNIEAQIPKVQEIFHDFLKDHKAQKFPGVVDYQRAELGRQVYSAQCASCHGTYDSNLNAPTLTSFPNKFIQHEVIRTDYWRWWLLEPSIYNFTKETIISNYVQAGVRLGGYVAPLLTGLWSSAPYLHNGSVPSVWELMHPASRPTKFKVGGHALDFTRLGVAYPQGYKPWSEPAVYDTQLKGRSNAGHEEPFDTMSLEQKRNLFEYLKLL